MPRMPALCSRNNSQDSLSLSLESLQHYWKDIPGALEQSLAMDPLVSSLYLVLSVIYIGYF